MNEIIRLKGYSKTDCCTKLNAIGMHATMHLLNLLWQDKTCIGLAKVKYDTTQLQLIQKTTNMSLKTYHCNGMAT